MRAFGLELLDHGQQVADRSGEAIEPHHDQGVAGADVAKEAGQDRPAPEASSSTVAQQAARSSSRWGSVPWSSVETPRVADQAASSVGFLAVLRHWLA
jgi:hypothetical protein